LNQANKLSRTYAMLMDAFNRHRGKGQQKVHGGACPCACRRPSGRRRSREPGG
jgi:hypothetical protein